MAQAEVVTKQIQPLVIQPAGSRDWSSGIFSCFGDCKSCFCVLCCTSCFLCKLASRLDEYCCAPLWVGVVPLRLKIRLMFGIRGSLCDDCVMLTCCAACALCQMSRELDAVGWHV